MAQRWSNLLFAHWRVPETMLRELIPEPLQIDTFDGSGWIGVVPFELRVRPRFLPVVPKIAAFPEINVRTYVTIDGKPGVWFFSLDATSPIAVRVARWQFNLPYFNAKMSCKPRDGGFEYASTRTDPGVGANFNGFYQATPDVYLAEPGSLDEVRERLLGPDGGLVAFAYGRQRLLAFVMDGNAPLELLTIEAGAG